MTRTASLILALGLLLPLAGCNIEASGDQVAESYDADAAHLGRLRGETVVIHHLWNDNKIEGGSSTGSQRRIRNGVATVRGRVERVHDGWITLEFLTEPGGKTAIPLARVLSIEHS